MGRGAKHTIGKVKARRPGARKSVRTETPSRAQLEKHLVEVLEQQAATSEILPGDQPVADRCTAGLRRDRGERGQAV